MGSIISGFFSRKDLTLRTKKEKINVQAVDFFDSQRLFFLDVGGVDFDGGVAEDVEGYGELVGAGGI